jgi:ribosomal RNA assembly protein
MQEVYIPHERIKAARSDHGILKEVGKACRCTIKVNDDAVEIEGDPIDEFTARSIVSAFGRGFDVETAMLLKDQDYYFKSIDLRQLEPNSKRIHQVKARIIGENGRAKRYIEEVSAAHISVYGDTVSIIGTAEQLYEAETAISTLVEGGTHKLAYLKMEAAHRKNKQQMHSAGF